MVVYGFLVRQTRRRDTNLVDLIQNHIAWTFLQESSLCQSDHYMLHRYHGLSGRSSLYTPTLLQLAMILVSLLFRKNKENHYNKHE